VVSPGQTGPRGPVRSSRGRKLSRDKSRSRDKELPIKGRLSVPVSHSLSKRSLTRGQDKSLNLLNVIIIIEISSLISLLSDQIYLK
jgi:hypothetical protein